MVKKVSALVNPALLKWARESFNLSVLDAAKKLGVNEKRMREWERGDNRPTFIQLMKLSKAYKRPAHVFYLSVAPKEDKHFTSEGIKDLRKPPNSKPDKYSPHLIYELRMAYFRRESYFELSELLHEDIDHFKLHRKENEMANIEALASRIRDVIGVPLEQQFQWEKPTEAYKHWRRALEQLNILVFQTGAYLGRSVEQNEMRGLAISVSPLPIIIVNGKDSPYARVFTLFHELGHLLLRQSAMRNNYSEYYGDDERDCNKFAGCLLVPEKILRQQVGTTKFTEPLNSNNAVVRELSGQFSVSREVIMRRLVDCGIAPLGYIPPKPPENESQRSGGGPPYRKKVLNWIGEPYSNLVLNAYDEGVITLPDVSTYLGVKIKHIEPIREELVQSYLESL